VKAYKKLLTQNLPMQNYLALNILLDKGRERLKKEKSYLSMVDNIEHSDNLVMVDFQKKVLEIARDMATLTHRELYEYIREEKIS